MANVFHRQQRTTTCAVAAIRTVLHHQFGLRVSESALVALGTSAHTPIITHGSDTADMRRTVRGASTAYNTTGIPWTLRVRSRGTLKDLKRALAQGRWPIAQVFVKERLEFHAVVITDINDTHVRVFDPDYSLKHNWHWMAKDRFQEWWTSPVNGETWWSQISGGVLQ